MANIPLFSDNIGKIPLPDQKTLASTPPSPSAGDKKTDAIAHEVLNKAPAAGSPSISDKQVVKETKLFEMTPTRVEGVARSILPVTKDIQEKRQIQLGKGGLTPSQSKMVFQIIADNARDWIDAAKKEGALVGRLIRIVDIPAEIHVLASGEIYISLLSKEGGIGEGVGKIVRRTIAYDSAEILAEAVAKYDPLRKTHKEGAEQEAKFLLQLQGRRGIVQAHRVIYSTVREDEKELVQQGLLQAFYENGDLASKIKKDQEASKASGDKVTKDNKDIEEKQFKLNMDIALSVLHGLEAIHKEGIIHNDIKPPNILCGRGTAVIADFGSAFTSGGWDVFSGTFPFDSPEAVEALRIYLDINIPGGNTTLSPEEQEKQLNFQEMELKAKMQVIGPPKDVWAMGMTLFILFFPNEKIELAGRSLPNPPQMNKAVNEFHERLETLGSTPQERALLQIIKKMLDPNPNTRISSSAARQEFEGIQFSSGAVKGA